MTAWNDLVKKVYSENKHKSGYTLGNAMKDASARKGEMKASKSTSKSKKSASKKTKRLKTKKITRKKVKRSSKRTRARSFA
jgi:hypothetical protein